MTLVFQNARPSRRRWRDGAATCRLEKYGGRLSLPKLWYLVYQLLSCNPQQTEMLLSLSEQKFEVKWFMA